MTLNSRTSMCMVLVIMVQIAGTGCRGLSELGRAIYYGADTKITFRVVDHDNNPVEDANVRVTLYRRSKLKKRKTVVLKEKTDAQGLLTVHEKSTGKMILWVTKEGYYQTWYDYAFGDNPQPFYKDGRWLPWNPTVDVLLKPKVNPISMYAKHVKLETPLADEPVGYDLKIGDWVAPHGNGQVADLLFKFSGQLKDTWTGSSDLTISANGEKAGIQICEQDTVSDFKSAHQAPADGYEKQVRFVFSRTKTEMIKDMRLEDNQYLVFRTRTKLDKNGNLIEACYGKIYAPLKFGPLEMGKKTSKGKLEFTYYFNPHGTRNLEFDLHKNLFNFKPSSIHYVGGKP